IAGHCYENQEPNPEDPCLACMVVVAGDAWSPLDGDECDDGNPCTLDDACWDGVCTGVARSCDDDNPCTTGQCQLDSGECAYAPVENYCDDGDHCTEGDLCVQGLCKGGAALDCDDGNLCTNDGCDPALGCVSTLADGQPCDDGSTCTDGDACAEGACAPGAPIDCDDSDICTIDTCSPTAGCEHESLADMCADSNPCTDDTCDAVLGCVYPPNIDPCDDENACTEVDTCTEGSCLGSPVSPDDGNPCTDDSCDPALGVINLPNTLPCDDVNACTLGDQCSNATCVPGQTPLDCEDDNGCTTDSCAPADGCHNDPNEDPCDDGLGCTEEDVCEGGACAGAMIDCDDGNDCTDDACVEGSGCESTLVLSNTCRPVISVSYPPRAATLEAVTAYVDVVGTVSSGAGEIVSVTINGVPADLVEDTFTGALYPSIGGNTLVIEATDAMGTIRKHVQALHWAEAYTPPEAMAVPGIGIWMAQETIDDGDHSLPPNDLATIFELVLDGYPLDGL
ncbi:MAG: hypothetical protein QF464_17100, partial [Myxococcota bacterium]|nr:hypothetical protein [Myxococcota bacterium]